MNRILGVTQRYECKYLVSEGEARRILTSALPFVQPDPHAEGRPDHAYPIASLYLDAAAFPLYRETVEGKCQRFKLRVRAYDDDPAHEVFLEVKSRHSSVVQKQRCPVDRRLLPVILAGESAVLEGLAPASRRSLDEFSRLVQVTGATPKVIVRYDRQAFVGVVENEVRVTFDRRLRVLQCTRPEVVVQSASFREIPTRSVVLELKFNDQCPTWLLNLVKRHALQRTSFSKYCRAVERACPGGVHAAT